VRVASGAPMALVAAGVPTPMGTIGDNLRDVNSGVDALRADLDTALSWINEQRFGPAMRGNLADIADATIGTYEMNAWNALADLAIALGDEGEFNWVEEEGGLPPYIKRIADHLKAEGMDESRAIATAKNAAQKMCDSGDTNFPGDQDVNPGSRAEACEAIAQWEEKRAARKG